MPRCTQIQARLTKLCRFTFPLTAFSRRHFSFPLTHLHFKQSTTQLHQTSKRKLQTMHSNEMMLLLTVPTTNNTFSFKTQLGNPTKNLLRPSSSTNSLSFITKQCIISLVKLNSRRHFCPCRSLPARDATHVSLSTDGDKESTYSISPNLFALYIPVFIGRLGLDNDPRDREQAVITLWKYSLGGKQCVDNIMQYPGCMHLTVNLLRAESTLACEAAAGLLRTISSVNLYRDIVGDSGAIEETAALLRRTPSTAAVKEQSICMLWNLSADEKHRMKIVSALLPLLLKSLDDEDIKVIEAAAGVLANLSLTPCTHSIMVQADAIPKLAKFLTTDVRGSKIVINEVKNALLELAKDDNYRISLMGEGLILVPLVGTAAFASVKQTSSGTEFRRTSNVGLEIGSSELPSGLDGSKMDVNVIPGETGKELLAEHASNSPTRYYDTLLPWKYGVTHLVLMLELQDEKAILRAAEAIATASINEQYRSSFMEAGAIEHLVSHLNHNNDAVRTAVLRALDRLSVSNAVCGQLVAHGVTCQLADLVKGLKTTDSQLEKTLSILARIWDPNTEMKLKFYGGGFDETVDESDSRHSNRSLLRGANLTAMKDIMDSALVSHMVDIFKSASFTLQVKIATVLEFVAMIEPCVDTMIAANIGPLLIAMLEQNVSQVAEADQENEEPDVAVLEEAGLAISSASSLLIRLLDYRQFCKTIDKTRLIEVLKCILKSNIPLRHKNLVGACLVKLSGTFSPLENPVLPEVTLYETVPRLIQEIKTSFSSDTQEAAVVELDRIFSEGVVGAERAVIDHEGILPLVKLIEEGSDTAVEAGLDVLYKMSMDSENHTAIIAAGADLALNRIVRSQRPKWTSALRLLRNLPV